VRCWNWRHGCSEHFTRHLKIHDDLSRIGIPNFDVLIKGRCDEQPGIHRIPNCRRNGELVAILVLLVHKQYVPVLRYEAGFVLGRVPHIEYSGRPIRCPGEQVSPLCSELTAPWCGVANSLRLESASEAARRARAAASNLRARSSPRSLPLTFSSHIQTGPLPVVPAASAVTRVQRRRPRQDEDRRGRVGCGRRCADRRGRDQLLLSEASIEFGSYTPIQIPMDFTGKY